MGTRGFVRRAARRNRLVRLRSMVVGLSAASLVVAGASAFGEGTPHAAAASTRVTVAPPNLPDTSHVHLPPNPPNAGPLSPAAPPSTKDAAPTPIDQALLQAKQTGQPVHVPSLDTGTTTTYANPDQTLTAVLSSGPVRVKTSSGWQAIDTNLVADASGVHPVAAADSLTLSDG